MKPETEALRTARDVLIKTKVRYFIDLARELDRAAWMLDHDTVELMDAPGYDYGTFLKHMETLLGGEK